MEVATGGAETFILECDDPNQVVTVAIVQELLKQKDENLQVAAEFGSQLIAKNSVLETENQNLTERIEARNQEMEQLYQQLAEYKADLQLISHQKDNNTDASNAGKADEESFELKSLRQKHNLACDQLKDAATTNSQLMAEIEQKNEILQKFRSTEKELQQYRTENETLHVQAQQKDQQIQHLNDQKVEWKREQRKLNDNIKQAAELQFSLESELSELKHSSQLQNTANQAKKKINGLQEDLIKAEELINDQEKRINELEWEKKNIEKAITSTLLRNQELEKERKEHLRFLDEARSSVANYRMREEEQTLELSMSLSDDNHGGNLLSELEKELEHRIDVEKKNDEPEEKTEKVQTNPTDKPQKAPVGAPENCEEYFFLAVTAIKISTAMKAPVGASGAFRINADALYQQLLESEIPFHEWYEWVKKQFERKLESFVEKEDKPVVVVPAPAPTEPDSIRAKFARFMRRSSGE